MTVIRKNKNLRKMDFILIALYNLIGYLNWETSPKIVIPSVNNFCNLIKSTLNITIIHLFGRIIVNERVKIPKYLPSPD